MNLEFYGGAGCVTGSSHILRVKDKTILLDCGLYQGKDEKERPNETFSFHPKGIDYVVLSHAHIDHSGRIPLLYKMGFKGQVISTKATADLCSVMLKDSGHIQEMENEWKNRKRIRQGLEPIEPLYTARIAELSTYLFQGYDYDELIEVFDGFKVRFRDAGHLLGSAIVEIFIKEENSEEVKLVYTGDLGNKNVPLIKDPTMIDSADYLIMESTYGDRLHTNINDEMGQFVQIIKSTLKKGGNVVIPSFAVGRTQEVLYSFNEFIESKALKDVTVYVDSPLAIESTNIFKRYSNCYDKEAQAIIESGNDPLAFDGLVFSSSAEDSAKINKIQSGAVIISASGMCEAGRIKHHLKHNLWRKECSIVFVGYQAEGTLGRAIVDGARKVKIFGEEIAVNAQIFNLHGLSGHADRNGLFEWVQGFKKKPKQILLVHGDTEAQKSFKELLVTNGYNARIMNVGDTFKLNEKVVKEENSRRTRIIELLNNLDNIDNLGKKEILAAIEKIL